MKKRTLLALLSATLLMAAFTTVKNGLFHIKARISGFEEGTAVFLIDAATNQVKDSAYFKNNGFEFLGKAPEDPKSLVLYIPLADSPKYTYLFMADENVEVQGDIADFPDNLVVTGSEHQKIKTDYDRRVAPFDRQMATQQQKIQQWQQQKKWNDSLQKAYFTENGILAQIDKQKTEEEKRFIAAHPNTYYGLQILYYKKSSYTDSQLKKIFNKFSKKLKDSENGKAIQAYLNSPALKKGDHYIDFTATDKTGASKKLSALFDGKKYVLLDFSTPTCPNSKAAIPMLKSLNKQYHDKLNLVTYYTENTKEHFDFVAKLETYTWNFLWTPKGKDGFANVRYRINSTPTYYLFDPDGKLIEKWSGFKEGYSDATQIKIEKLLGL